MHPLSEPMIRASFVNTSLRERINAPIPDVEHVYWDDLDYLAWPDRKNPHLFYLAVDLDGDPTAIMLRRSENRLCARAQCSWCEDVRLPNDVVFFSAARSGDSGTLGTLVCANFECSANVRQFAPSTLIGFDHEAERDRRIASLRQRVRNFVRRVSEPRS